MNTEKKEHVVTEVYYPLGFKIPYLRRTGNPLERMDYEFVSWLKTCTVEQLKSFIAAEATPFGYRALEVGETVQLGDECIPGGKWEKVTSTGFPVLASEIPYLRTTRPKPTNIAPKTDFYPRPSPCPNFDPKGDEGKKKPQLQLIPPVLNTELAKALSFGAAKYEPWNWRKNKVEYMTYLGAMKRHIDALLEREDVASDSGVHHLGHIAASCAILLDAAKHGTLVDNRPPGKLNSEPVVDNGAFNGVE